MDDKPPPSVWSLMLRDTLAALILVPLFWIVCALVNGRPY
jgi:hypothetical protein